MVSNHAYERMDQRGLKECQVDLITRFGEKRRDRQRGSVKFVMTEKRCREVVEKLISDIQLVKKSKNRVVVLNDDETTIITAW